MKQCVGNPFEKGGSEQCKYGKSCVFAHILGDQKLKGNGILPLQLSQSFSELWLCTPRVPGHGPFPDVDVLLPAFSNPYIWPWTPNTNSHLEPQK